MHGWRCWPQIEERMRAFFEEVFGLVDVCFDSKLQHVLFQAAQGFFVVVFSWFFREFSCFRKRGSSVGNGSGFAIG